MIRHIDDAYQIYWNGQLIGQHGSFPPHAVWYAFSQPPQTFAWPAAGDGVLAFRVWKAPLLSEDSGTRGGFIAAPLAGTSEAIAAAKAKLDYEWLRSRQFLFGENLLYALVALLGLLAWVRDRQQWTLLWMAIFAFASIASLILFGLGLPWPKALADCLASPFSSLRDISLWYLLLTLLDLRRKRFLVRLTQIFAVVSLASNILDGLLGVFFWTSPWQNSVQIADGILTAVYVPTAALPLLLVGYAFFRRWKLNAAPELVAVLAFLSGMIQVAQNVAPQGSRFTHWTLADKIATPLFTLNGNSVSLAPLAGMLLFLSIAFAVYRAALESRRRQLELEQEFRSARELQQVLIPESQQSLPGYAFSSAYLPAAEVGGDFFQLIALEGSRAGSTLLIVGDVSGKGLKAAMSVAVIVGAVRTLTEISSSPGEILAGINRRLYGRMQGGLVTCLAMRLDPDGDGVIANAGHLPPYLNGKEMDLPGALPLGLIPGISYDEFSLSFRPEDHLTLFTDGLLEARKQDGQLFGFERMQQLLANRPSASEAAKAAVEFGQDDDITVLTLTRLP